MILNNTGTALDLQNSMGCHIINNVIMDTSNDGLFVMHCNYWYTCQSYNFFSDAADQHADRQLVVSTFHYGLSAIVGLISFRLPG